MLRITKFLNRSTVELQLAFSEPLNQNIGVNNVRVRSNLANASDLTVKAVDITNTVLTITVSEQAARVIYYIELLSTEDQSFSSTTGTRIQENGVTNRIYFVGLEDVNDVRDTMINDAPPVYDLDTNTLIRKYLSNFADQLLRARTDVRETGNANYLCERVTDEIKTRGFGATDRLDNESAFRVLRVARNAEGALQTSTVNYNEAQATALLGSEFAKSNTGLRSFPGDPVSLRGIRVTETVSNAERINNRFDGLIVTLSKNNVAAINAITLNTVGGDSIVYDIPTHGYSLLSNRYDTAHGFTLLTLENNQFKLAESAILEGDFEVPTGADSLTVSYTYLDNGIDVTPDSLSVSRVEQAIREPIGAFLTVFSLKNFPIVNVNDRILNTGGVQFLDPAPSVGDPFTVTHPAFTQELAFNSNRLPAAPGEYSINYNTGQVFVYGASSADGTGSAPPVATYRYRRSFRETIDYNFDSDADEVVAVPGRDLAGTDVKVTYSFDQILTEGVDYLAEVHNEVSNELAENRLINSFTVATQNRPITDVFELFNETTGETYVVTRFDDNYIYFTGRQLPRIANKGSELVEFARVSGEEMFITEEIETTGTYKVVAIQLQNNNIVTSAGYFRGDNVNSSISIERNDLFVREFYYDNVLQTVDQNLAKLSAIGDYVIDYARGLIYLRTDPDQSFALGGISYQHGSIVTQSANVLGVNALEYRRDNAGDAITSLEIEGFGVSTIEAEALAASTERFLSDNPNKPILLGATHYGQLGQYTLGGTSFVSLDANFTDEYTDGYHTLRIEGDSDRDIISVVSPTEIIVSPAFTDTRRARDWCIIDGNPIFPTGDGYKTITTHDIVSIRGIYAIPELQTLDKDSLTNYYDSSTDTFSGNKIFLNNDAVATLAPGTALAIDYAYGRLFADYDYVVDNLRLTYEYGDNSLNFSVSDTLQPNDEYYVTYEYGALREELISNFGALTQLQELISVPLDFDRELYRDFLKGTLQGFVAGPTTDAIQGLVEQVTNIEPDIRELTFDEWTASRDNLFLDEADFEGPEVYDAAKHDSGLYIGPTNTLSFPEEAYVSYREGSFQTWVKPDWNGLDNDATLTFNIGQDGYLADDTGLGFAGGGLVNLDEIFIGASAFNPTDMPFSINRTDPSPNSPVGRPVNFGQQEGYYIWYDDANNDWVIAGVGDPTSGATLTGRITTSGEFYNVRDGYKDFDGYALEVTDRITSTKSFVDFVFTFDGYETADGYDGYTFYDGYSAPDGYLFHDEIRFLSDNLHYLMDAGPHESHNRISIFKDGAGFLNFRVFDDTGRRHPGRARQYNISTDISDWVNGDLHMVGASWRLNSAEGIDELHLFVDGQEVSNLFKFGGRPQTASTDVYRTVADEVITTSALKTVIGGQDGVSTASSTGFTSASSTFVTDGVVGGDTLHILDATADGAGSPYTILSVSDENTLVLTAPLTLSLEDVSFSVNQTAFSVETNVDVEDFAVFATDGYGNTRELHGLDAVIPDYFVTRDGGANTLTFTDNVDAGDELVINTLGLTTGRCRDITFKYDGYDGYASNTIETRFAPPKDLNHFDVYKIPMLRTSIEDLESPLNVDGYFSVTGNTADGYFTNLCQPSETTNGKAYAVTLGGLDNTDFTGTNTVTIYGSTFSGATSELLTFTEYGTLTTTEYFTSLDAVETTFTAVDGYESFGSLTISEAVPFTRTENGGEYAQPVSYDNGVVTLLIFGSGGLPYNLESCYYRFDYPIDLNIPMKTKGRLYLGSDINGENQWNGVLDQVIFLNDKLDDIRTGEDKGLQRTMTQDFNSPLAAEITPQTLMLLPLNEDLSNIDQFYVNFDEEFLTTSSSVNENFGDAAVFMTEPYIIDNGSVVFNNNEGSIEFWVNPLVDTLFDENHTRYYVDITSVQVDTVTSTTAVTLQLPQRARRVISVRLLGDDGTGIDYFVDGRLAVDGLTVLLGQQLPGQQTLVQVEYVPIDFNGDRVSIFKDGYGSLNFAITADDELFQISYPISWRRDTWHRVMATWRTNTVDGVDRMRLFIDGVESGTITYGTPGLLYGSGVVYGSAAVGSLAADFLTTDINLTDTFGQVYIGNSFNGRGNSKAKIDNLRFSGAARQPSIVAGVAVDLNYNSNLEAVSPVIEDNITTALFNFDMQLTETEFLSNLLSKFTPLFQFDVNVDDSFRRIIDDDTAKDLLIKIINRMKPAHANLFVRFLQE